MTRTLFTPLVATLVSSLLSACTMTPVTTKFYSLSPTPVTQQLQGPNASVGIGPISFPDMLKRPQVIIRSSENTVELSESHHWAGSLEQNFEKVLIEGIANTLANTRIRPFPWDTRQRPQYQIILTIYQFDGHPKKSVALRASWTLVSTKSREELSHHKQTFNSTPLPTTHKGMTQALSDVTQKLASSISKSISNTKLIKNP